MRPLIFDFDGVIADSEQIVGEAMAQTLTEFGIPTTVEQSFERYLGRSYADVVKIIEAEYGGPLPPEFRKIESERVQTKVKTDLKPVKGVEDFLKTLDGVKIGIASSSSEDWIRKGLEKFGFSHYFGNHIYSAVGLPRAKPHPDVYLHAAKQMRIDINKAIIIEDSFNGVTAGVAAGATVIGLMAGSHIRPYMKQGLLDAGAHYIARSYAEVKDFQRSLD